MNLFIDIVALMVAGFFAAYLTDNHWLIFGCQLFVAAYGAWNYYRGVRAAESVFLGKERS